MDRPTTRMDADARGSRLNPHEVFVLQSRRPALDLCRGTLEVGASIGTGAGPILVTGDAGVGKTWLWRCLEAEASPSHRWIGVDLTPANDPADFYRLIAHELGLIEPRTTEVSRVELIDFLAERQADGERLTLVIEEAHNLSIAVWEEVRVLANRLDRSGGFSSMVLVGQTSLARRFSTRPFASIEARLALRVHLGPIDADEAKELLTRLRPGRDWPVNEVEALHRDAAGNPRRMLRRLGPVTAPMVAPSPIELLAKKAVAPIEPSRKAIEPSPRDVPTVPLTGPDKPPIQVEENMIEVGWSPDDATLPDASEENSAHGTNISNSTQEGEEAVLDHYAALQAWQEWSENQSRRSQQSLASPDPGSELEAEPDVDIELDEDDEEHELPVRRPDRTTIRAEGEQKFAPFGQLFSRMAQAREPE